MMLLTTRALQNGPAGLTFAFQNTSAVFPGMILFILFGIGYGFPYSYTQFLGIILVILGLFLGARNQSNHPSTKVTLWFKYALGCLLVQVLALTLLQVRCVFCSHAENVESFSFVSQEDASFLLGQFGSAFCIQFLYFFTQKKTLPKQSIVYGTLGGSANFFSTYFLFFFNGPFRLKRRYYFLFLLWERSFYPIFGLTDFMEKNLTLHPMPHAAAVFCWDY